MDVPPHSLAAPRRGWRGVLALPLALAASAGGWALLLGALYVSTLDLPDLHEAPRGTAAATVLYAADGHREVARYYREHRLPVTGDAIAPVVVQALVATEDHRFHRHRGVDWRRLAAAAWWTLRGDRQGGSTLAMQLARNRYPSIAEASPYRRKLLEVLMALRLERHHTKREVAELYLNTVAFGRRAFGIEAAAYTYFGERAATLDTLQAATLVGLLKATTYYDPVRYPERARLRRDVVLGRMAGHGVLTGAQHARLAGQPITLRPHSASLASSPAPHFAEHVRRWLEDWGDARGVDLYTAGLRVTTTLDPALQRQARDAVRTQLQALQDVAAYEWSRPAPRLLGTTPGPYRGRDAAPDAFAHLRAARSHLRAVADSALRARTRLQAGLVALDPGTGHAKAWVGSPDFFEDAYDHVALARRQPGSTFKPFLYAAAVDRGYAPADVLRRGSIRRTTSEVLFAADTSSARTVSLRDGLAYSSNAVARQLMHELGPAELARTARKLGVRSPLQAVPSLALGTSDVTLLEMGAAYATLANGGLYNAPTVVTRIEDRNGNILYEARPAPRKAISAHTAYTVLDMMRDVVDRGTAHPLRRTFGLEGDLAAKTGTTQHNADGWLVAMRPDLVAGAWVGFNDRRIHFRTEHWGRGANNALRLVGAFLQLAPPPAFPGRFAPPPGYREPQPLDTLLLREQRRTPPAPTDTLALPDAFAQGLSRPSFDAPSDALARRDANPEAALRRAVAPAADTTDADRFP